MRLGDSGDLRVPPGQAVLRPRQLWRLPDGWMGSQSGAGVAFLPESREGLSAPPTDRPGWVACAALAAPTRLPGSCGAGLFPSSLCLPPGADRAPRRQRRSWKGRREIRQAPNDETVWHWKTQSGFCPPALRLPPPHPNPEVASVPIGRRRSLNSPEILLGGFLFAKEEVGGSRCNLTGWEKQRWV